MVLSIGILILFLVIVVRIVYAYYTIDMNAVLNEINTSTNIVNEFRFIHGDPLVVHIKNEGEESKSVSSSAKVYLKANETTKMATYHYYAYLEFLENNFVYTTEEKTPEVILSIRDGVTQQEITQLEGLKYSTVEGVSGFDVTSYRGLLKIADDAVITSDSCKDATIHEYIVTLTYLNLPYNQIENVGSTIKAELSLQTDPIKINQ